MVPAICKREMMEKILVHLRESTEWHLFRLVLQSVSRPLTKFGAIGFRIYLYLGAHVAERRIHLLVEKLYDFHPVSITKLRLDNHGVFIHSVFIGFTGFFAGIFVIEVGRLPKVEEHFAAAALDSDSCLGKLGYFSNNR
jgi:hypothetical protein